MDRETSRTGTPAIGLTGEAGIDPDDVVPLPAFAGPPGARAVVAVATVAAGRLHDCLVDTRKLTVRAGDRVVVDSPRGPVLAVVKRDPREPTRGEERDLPRVARLALPEDLEAQREASRRDAETFRVALHRLRQHRLRVKLIKTEHQALSNRVVVYFAAEQRHEFRDFVQELGRELRARVEMRQVGVRDEAKVLGGIGHCGRELCCSTWLRDFMPVSIRMAKDQNLALTPTKVSGLCGRLMCCLSYEHDTYKDLRKALPKAGRTVPTRFGPGRVVHLEVLAQRFTVVLENGQRAVCAPEDWLRDPGDPGATEAAEPDADGEDEALADAVDPAPEGDLDGG